MGQGTTRRFEFNDGKSSKFWEIELAGAQFTVRYGKIGTAGQSQVKEFTDAAAASKAADKLISEKTRKGYQEIGAVSTAGSAESENANKAPEKLYRYFEFDGYPEEKFWEIALSGVEITLRQGKKCTPGKTQVKTFDSAVTAEKRAKKLITAKVESGFQEILSVSDSLAMHEEVKRLVQTLRRKVSADFPSPPSEDFYSRTTFDNYLDDLDRGGIAWKFVTDYVPLQDVDRRKSMVCGPAYFAADYPLPVRREDGKYLLPCIQADLRELSELRGVPLGDGLLQVFAAWDEWTIRVIPRAALDAVAPLPFPTDISLFEENARYRIEQWMTNSEPVVTMITGYSEPHIHYDERGEPDMWVEMVAERLDAIEADVSFDAEWETNVISFKNAMTDSERKFHAPPPEYARLVQIVERLKGSCPRGGDQVFGSFHGIHSRPHEMIGDCLFAFEGEFFNFSGAGNSHVMYSFIDGKPTFDFTIAACN